MQVIEWENMTLKVPVLRYHELKESKVYVDLYSTSS